MFHYADSGFGNLVYIVLAVVYLLYNLFGAGKKKNKYPPKQGQDTPRQPADSPFDLEKWLREQVEQKTAPEPEQKSKKKVEQPVLEPASKHQRMQRDVMRVENTRKTRERKPLEVIEDNSEPLLIRGIPAREAIIVSEILKRPDYL